MTQARINRKDFKKSALGKFKNERIRIDGILFDSKWEAKVYHELKILERCMEISDLKHQVPFPLKVNETTIGKYIADFTYYENGEFIVADAKGVETQLFKWKQKHFEAQYKMKLTLIKKGNR